AKSTNQRIFMDSSCGYTSPGSDGKHVLRSCYQPLIPSSTGVFRLQNRAKAHMMIEGLGAMMRVRLMCRAMSFVLLCFLVCSCAVAKKNLKMFVTVDRDANEDSPASISLVVVYDKML